MVAVGSFYRSYTCEKSGTNTTMASLVRREVRSEVFLCFQHTRRRWKIGLERPIHIDCFPCHHPTPLHSLAAFLYSYWRPSRCAGRKNGLNACM
jgi:hypothetical protein